MRGEGGSRANPFTDSGIHTPGGGAREGRKTGHSSLVHILSAQELLRLTLCDPAQILFTPWLAWPWNARGPRAGISGLCTDQYV